MDEPVSTQSEIFFGWTQAELEALRLDFKRQIQEEGLDKVTSAGVGGKSVMNGQRLTLQAWMIYLREALQELDPLSYGAPTRVSHAVACVGYLPK